MNGNVNWTIPGDSMPDDDMNVLIAMKDGEVWPAYRSAGVWFYICGGHIEPDRISHWTDFPEAPTS